MGRTPRWQEVAVVFASEQKARVDRAAILARLTQKGRQLAIRGLSASTGVPVLIRRLRREHAAQALKDSAVREATARPIPKSE